MDNKTKAVIIGIFLLGTAVGYFIRAPEVSALRFQVDALKKEITSLTTVIDDLGKMVEEISQSCVNQTSLSLQLWSVSWESYLLGNFIL